MKRFYGLVVFKCKIINTNSFWFELYNSTNRGQYESFSRTFRKSIREIVHCMKRVHLWSQFSWITLSPITNIDFGRFPHIQRWFCYWFLDFLKSLSLDFSFALSLDCFLTWLSLNCHSYVKNGPNQCFIRDKDDFLIRDELLKKFPEVICCCCSNCVFCPGHPPPPFSG